MADIVLVPGGWSGGWAWKRVAPLLRAQGHNVFTPTLTGLGERIHLASPQVNLDTHILDIVNLLRYEDLEQAVLVGWSYSGMVVTGVLDRVPERLAHVVYLDAFVPQDGESLFDISKSRDRNEQIAQAFGEGWKIPLDAETIMESFAPWLPDEAMRRWNAAKLASSPQPIETFRQPVRLTNPAADAVPRTFIRTPVAGEAGVFGLLAERLRNDPLWQVVEIASTHLAPLKDPELVAEALLAIIRGLPAEA